MKILKIATIALSLIIGHMAAAEEFKLNKSIFAADKEPPLKHHGDGPMDSYLTMNLAYLPAKDLFDQITLQKKVKLKTRGEAHITVVTPVEYWKNLRPKGVTIDEIDRIASEEKIQSSEFKIVCLGQGNAAINAKLESTFFVVVESSDLIKIRRKIQELLISKGGTASDFDPDNFYPHITIGYTERDLHESDAVIKDKKSCIANIQVQ